MSAPHADLRPTLALGTLAALLAAATAWPWLAPTTVPAPARAVPRHAAAETRLRPLPPIASFAAIVERPLFAPSRRPSAAAAPATAGPIGLRYRLVGIVAADRDRRALLVGPAAPHPAELRVGSTIDGWTVTGIEQDRVLLTGPGGPAVLTFDAAAPAAAGKR